MNYKAEIELFKNFMYEIYYVYKYNIVEIFFYISIFIYIFEV